MRQIDPKDWATVTDREGSDKKVVSLPGGRDGAHESYLILSDNLGLSEGKPKRWCVWELVSTPSPSVLSDGSIGSGPVHLIGLDGICDQCVRGARHALEIVILPDGTEKVCKRRWRICDGASSRRRCPVRPRCCEVTLWRGASSKRIKRACVCRVALL